MSQLLKRKQSNHPIAPSKKIKITERQDQSEPGSQPEEEEDQLKPEHQIKCPVPLTLKTLNSNQNQVNSSFIFPLPTQQPPHFINILNQEPNMESFNGLNQDVLNQKSQFNNNNNSLFQLLANSNNSSFYKGQVNNEEKNNQNQAGLFFPIELDFLGQQPFLFKGINLQTQIDILILKNYENQKNKIFKSSSAERENIQQKCKMEWLCSRINFRYQSGFSRMLTQILSCQQKEEKIDRKQWMEYLQTIEKNPGKNEKMLTMIINILQQMNEI